MAAVMTLAVTANPAAARPATIQDEADVPPYQLPDVLAPPGGDAAASAGDWHARVRPALLASFAADIYGPQPDTMVAMTAIDEGAHRSEDGRLLFHQHRLAFKSDHGTAAFNVLLVTPSDAGGPLPVFIGLNFFGNHTLHPAPFIQEGPLPDGVKPLARGERAERFQLDAVTSAGFAMLTASRMEIAPDTVDQWQDGVAALFPKNAAGRTETGAIGLWAWALSRMLDHAAAHPLVDDSRAVVFGHSRLGKTALWTGALDERFQGVISNNSGCMGAAISRRRFGETVERIHTRFPHWFHPDFGRFAGREDDLPVDQHHLLALSAPRVLHVASAVGDAWADPLGEFIATREASRVWSLLDAGPAMADEPPGVGIARAPRVAYHLREGKHDINAIDWAHYLATFAHLASH
jgi:hypothetical protein